MSNFSDLKQIRDDIDSLDRQDLDLRLRPIFLDIKKILTKVIDTTLVLEEDYDSFIEEDKNELNIIINSTLSIFNKAKNFSLPDNLNIDGIKNTLMYGLLEESKELYRDFKNKMSFFLGLSRFNSDISLANDLFSDFTPKYESAAKDFDSKIDSFKEIINDSNKLIEEAQQFKESAEKSSLGITTAGYIKVFGIQAANNFWTAFVFGLVLGISIIIFIYLLLSNDFLFISIEKIKEINTESSILLYVALLGKASIFALFYVLIHNLIKIMNSNLRLYNINKHRHNTLQTHFIFLDSKDEDVRIYALKKIVDTIFSIEDDGILSKGKELSVSDIADLIKTVK